MGLFIQPNGPKLSFHQSDPLRAKRPGYKQRQSWVPFEPHRGALETHKAVWSHSEGAAYSHVKPQVLFLFEEEIQDKLPDEIRIPSVIDDLRPAKLAKEKAVTTGR